MLENLRKQYERSIDEITELSEQIELEHMKRHNKQIKAKDKKIAKLQNKINELETQSNELQSTGMDSDVISQYIEQLERIIFSANSRAIEQLDTTKAEFMERYGDIDGLFKPDESNIEVERIIPVSHKSTQAFADVKMHGLILKGFRVVERYDGTLFASMPCAFDEKEERFFPTVIGIREETKKNMSKSIVRAYQKSKEV